MAYQNIFTIIGLRIQSQWCMSMPNYDRREKGLKNQRPEVHTDQHGHRVLAVLLAVG